MPDIVSVQYKQTGQSKSTNTYGMREMQERAFEYRDAQYFTSVPRSYQINSVG